MTSFARDPLEGPQMHFSTAVSRACNICMDVRAPSTPYRPVAMTKVETMVFRLVNPPSIPEALLSMVLALAILA